MAKMMSEEPAGRYQQPGEVAAALAPFIRQGAKASPAAVGEFPRGATPDRTSSAKNPEPRPTVRAETLPPETGPRSGVESSEQPNSSGRTKIWIEALRRRPALMALILTALLFGGMILAVAIPTIVKNSRGTAGLKDVAAESPTEGKNLPLIYSLRFTDAETIDHTDFLHILHKLGAVLAIPKDVNSKQFWIVDDLGARPARLQEGELPKTRAYPIPWRPTINSWMETLGLTPRPSNIAVYFPRSFEDELRRQAVRYSQKKGWKVEEIESTNFKIADINGKLVPVIIDQTKKK